MRRALATVAVTALAAVAGAFPGAAPGAAMVTGLGDQNPRFFDHPSFQEMRIRYVRVVVPWDAALTDDPRAREWIELALARGLVPLVAFAKGSRIACPGVGCQGPSPAAYEAAVAAFRARWPQVSELTPWNEPNHRSQPTYSNPGLAAQYYNAARRACPQCDLVAGDLLDDGNLAAWLADYQRTLVEQPAVWGLHNYYDATYFTSGGLDTLARNTTGRIWLTETGGIVRFTPTGGGGLAYDEERAANSIRWLYALTARQPRVARMYIYHWQGLEDNDFDGGLVGPQGQSRPGLAVVREQVGVRGDRAASTRTGGDPASGDRRVVLRLSGSALRLVRRGLRVAVACVSAPERCTGRLVVTIPRAIRAGYRPRLLMNLDLRRGQSIVRDLRTSRLVRRALLRQRRLQVTYCLGGTRACRTVQRRLLTRGSGHPRRRANRSRPAAASASRCRCRPLRRGTER